MKENKTNAMRLLQAAGIEYRAYTYQSDGAIDGLSVAQKVGLDPATVYKTLVTRGKSGEHAVFVISVSAELDLKAAARAVGEKAVEMIAVRDLPRVTGYVRGGCSPVGMKKPLRTVFDQSAQALPWIVVSGGRIGLQVACEPQALCRLVGGRFAPVTQEAVS